MSHNDDLFPGLTAQPSHITDYFPPAESHTGLKFEHTNAVEAIRSEGETRVAGAAEVTRGVFARVDAAPVLKLTLVVICSQGI